MTRTLALIPTHTQHNRLGLRSTLAHRVAGMTVLELTVRRALSISKISGVVLVHPREQNPVALLSESLRPKVLSYACDELFDDFHAMRTSARKWALAAWRGGLGGMTCYDELLPAAPLCQAMRIYEGDSAVLLGADWALLDPRITSDVLALHLSDPQGFQMTFSQAPPGLAGLAIHGALLEQMSRRPDATFGRMLSYVPSHPQADPIGKDVCLQIPPEVRSCTMRFVADTRAGVNLLEALSDTLGSGIDQAEAIPIVNAAATLDPLSLRAVPRWVTCELTPHRSVTGPITPQSAVTLDRPPLSLDAAQRLVAQLGEADDIALELGGLGDALLHPQWQAIVRAAHEAGVWGIALRTDLLAPPEVVQQLLTLPIDVLVVNLNADTAATYQKVMGVDAFKQATDNLQTLLVDRPKTLLPWIVPTLVKTPDTLGDMETFFDRWTHFSGHAVIAPENVGCGLSPRRFPLTMAPPRRRPCRQLVHRLTIHSDGRVPRCDQDWLARAPLGDLSRDTLADLWNNARSLHRAHTQGRANEMELCSGCEAWHRP